MLLVRNKVLHFFLNLNFFYFYFLRFFKIFFNFFFFFSFLNVVRDLIFLKKKMVFFKKNKINNFQIYSKTLKKARFKKNKKVSSNNLLYSLKNFYFFKEKFPKYSKKTVDLKKKFFDLNLKARKEMSKFLKFKNRLKFFKKKIFSFLKLSKLNKFFYFDFFIWYALLKNNFVLTVSDSFFLIINNFVFLNGKNLTNFNHFLQPGDLVQLVVHTKFLIFVKNFSDILKNSMQRIKKKIWNSFKQKNFKNKNSKNSLSSLAQNLLFYKSKLLFFYEVDYFSFSFFLVYKPVYFFEHSFFFSKFINFFMFRLYNWKVLS